MENTNQPQSQIFGGPSNQKDLPNATAVLVLGIISIVGCFCHGIPGTICGIIALILASKDRKSYNATPELYTLQSYKNLNAGRTCAIIGLSISILWILILIGLIITVGISTALSPWEMYSN